MGKKFLFTHAKKLFVHVLQAVHLQVIISFVYIPILICWGLPISLMSVVGNLIFTPFLIAFIFCSFFVVLTQIFYIPNQPLCALLDFLSMWWFKALTLGSPAWLMGFAYPGALALVLFVASGLMTFWLTRRWPLPKRTILISTVLLAELLLFKLFTPAPEKHMITYHKKKFFILNKNGALTLVIQYMHLAEKSFNRWITHTLRQELYHTFGHCTIKTVVLVNPTQKMATAIQENQQALGYPELITKEEQQLH